MSATSGRRSPTSANAVNDAQSLEVAYNAGGGYGRSGASEHVIGGAVGEAPWERVDTSRVGTATTAQSDGTTAAARPRESAVAADNAVRPAAVSNGLQPQVAVLAGVGMPAETMFASDGGFVHESRWYRGVAATRPVFLPPDDFLVLQPQLWTQCACERNCIRCVYDGEEFCAGCRASALSASSNTLYRLCDCEPGCCGLPGSTDGSKSEASGSANAT